MMDGALFKIFFQLKGGSLSYELHDDVLQLPHLTVTFGLTSALSKILASSCGITVVSDCVVDKETFHGNAPLYVFGVLTSKKVHMNRGWCQSIFLFFRSYYSLQLALLQT